MSYRDLRQFLDKLEVSGLLRHVAAGVDKNWEISATARWIYQGNPEENRYSVVFDNVKDYSIPVVLGAIGASYRTYALALGIEPAGSKSEVMAAIRQRWAEALEKPIKPVMVQHGTCQEVVLKGDEVDLHRLPVPVWTPGKDGNSDKGLGFLTAPCHITKDPETGLHNMGTYRSMLREQKNEMGINFSHGSHIQDHLAKNEARGRPTEVATVLGPDPAVTIASCTRVPESVDELAIAGALRGGPVEMVKCRTIDVEVPASAEIVIESRIRPSSERGFDWEGPFGEATGYQGCATLSPVLEVNCITHRRNPVYQALVSQMPPSESSKIRQIGTEALTLKRLRDVGIEGLEDISMPESGQTRFIAAAIKKSDPSHPERVARAMFRVLQPRMGKIIMVTDDDVDIYDLDNVIWALCFRTSLTPGRVAVHLIEGLSTTALDYSSAPSLEAELKKRATNFTWPGVGLFIDATRPYDPYPVVSLPPAPFLEKARDDWGRYGLPGLARKDLPQVVKVEARYLEEGKATARLMDR